MSRKDQFLKIWFYTSACIYRSGIGGQRTREVRDAVGNWHGFFLLDPRQIKGRHIEAFARQMLKKGLAVGTVQNRLAHLRQILRAIGKKALAEQYSNAVLRLPERSRRGTKRALLQEELDRIETTAREHGRIWLHAIVLLQLRLGLRRLEALFAHYDQLVLWRSSLQIGDLVHITRGTKGSRPRTCKVINRTLALATVEFALTLVNSADPFLARQANGCSVNGSKQAAQIHDSWMKRIKVQSHAAWYAFAIWSVQRYVAAGSSLKEALAARSVDLGHGEGRGLYIRQVYLANPVDMDKVAK